ncbi:MAG: PASTA domain-containing protein [Planctomycetota bacterium]
MTETQAEAALNGVGLNKGAVTASYSETVPAGLVISSTPPAGTSVACAECTEHDRDSGRGRS